MSIIGIILSMFAGYILHAWWSAESNGFIHFSYPIIKQVRFFDEEPLWAHGWCDISSPYWYTWMEEVHSDEFSGPRCSYTSFSKAK